MDFKWMTTEVIGRSIAVFTACFLSTQYVTHVLTLDALVTFIMTTWIACFAKNWLTSMVSGLTVDALHEYLLIQVSAVLIVPALVWFLSTDPTDVTIRTALALSRNVGFGIAAIVTSVAQFEKSLFGPVSFQYMVLPLYTLAVVYTVQLFYNSSVNVDKRSGNLASTLQIDLCLSTVCGLVCLVAPHLPASLFHQNLDDLHTYLYRLYGAMTLGYCCLPWVGPKFRASANRRAVLFSRALSMMMTLLVTFRKYRRGDIPEGMGSSMMIASLIILTLPSALGSMRHEHAPGWDLPWRGLRVPNVPVGGNTTQNLYQAAKDLQKLSMASPMRRKRPLGRSRHRGLSRGRSRSRKR